MMFCAVCTDDIPNDARPRYLDGARICDACSDEPVDANTPEQYQRGYRGGEGGLGYQFGRQLIESAKRVIPERVAKLDSDWDNGIPPPSPIESDPAWRDDGLSRGQIQYQSRRQGRNRTPRKGSL